MHHESPPLSPKLPVLAALMLMALLPKNASSAHPVTTKEAVTVTSTAPIEIMGDVRDQVSNESSITSPSTRYRISVKIPRGANPALQVGDTVKVTLPTIHNSQATSSVKAIAAGSLELSLANQVQLLDGQRLKVSVPLRPTNLFKVPFQAVYSPRGEKTEVFRLLPDQRVELVPFEPLQLLPDGNIVGASEGLTGRMVVVEGTNGLLSGDKVKVLKKIEGARK